MKTIIEITSKKLLLGLIGVLSLTGCAKDSLNGVRDGKKEVLFSINIPGKSSASTRSLSDEQESEVKTIEMLLFDEVSKTVVGNPIFANTIVSDPDVNGDFHKKSFSVKLPMGSYDVMVFANSREAFNVTTIANGDDQEATLAKLKAFMPALGWDADGSGTDYFIPMWGMKESVIVGEGVKVTGIYLHRMLSRVDLSVVGDVASTGDFKLKDVKLYNMRHEGRIAPMMANWDPNGLVNGTLPAGLATAPSLAGDGAHIFGISYQAVIAADKKSCVREMYVFEAPKAIADADQNAPYMTIKGEFDGVDGWYRIDLADYSDMTYLDVLRNHLYKIQITQVTGTGFTNEEDAKRNRADNIVVATTVWNEFSLGGTVFDGQHYLSINPQDIDYSKTEAIGNELTIRTDNQSAIPTFKMSSDPKEPNHAITWIKNEALGAATPSGDINTYKLSYDVEANTGLPRTGYIHVTLGRLTNVVRIRQGDDVSLSLDIFQESSPGVFDRQVNMLTFAQTDNTAPDARKYKIKWRPVDAKVAINISSLGAEYGLVTWSGPAPDAEGVISDPFGEKIFSVQPVATLGYVPGSFTERQSLLTARMLVAGVTELKTLIFQHVVKDMQIIHEGAYIMDGIEKKHFMTVKSNVPWEVAVNKNISSGLGTPNVPVVKDLPVSSVPFSQGEYNLPQGNKIFFTPVDDITQPEIYMGTLGVEVREQTLPANIVKADLLCATGVPQDGREANSYVLDPRSGVGLLIPVRNANGVITTRGGVTRSQPNWISMLGVQIDNDAYKAYGAKLIWTDTPNDAASTGLANDAALSIVTHAGEGPDGYILVMPGKSATPKMGNAVVAITRTPGVGGGEGTGDILWSFHIWVTDYNPYDANGLAHGNPQDGNDTRKLWMDRNLGATNTDPLDVGSLGNYYQWGRKDAFPGAATRSQNSGSPRTVYGINGVTPHLAWGSFSNAYYSVTYPMTASLSWGGSNENYSTLSWSTTTSLTTGLKTAYDPCPDGWRVPLHNALMAWSDTNNHKHWGREESDVSFVAGGWIPAKLGIDWPSDYNYKGGYYPGAGNFYNGVITKVGAESAYWSAFIISGKTNAYVLSIGAAVVPSANAVRNNGLSVRCVAE